MSRIPGRLSMCPPCGTVVFFAPTTDAIQHHQVAICAIRALAVRKTNGIRLALGLAMHCRWLSALLVSSPFIVSFEGTALADEGVPRPSAPLAAESTKPLRKLELRALVELLPRQGVGSMSEYTPAEDGWAYGAGAEALWHPLRVLWLGGGLSVDRVRGEATAGDSVGRSIDGYLAHEFLIAELGIPLANFGRLVLGTEFGFASASVQHVAYHLQRDGDELNGGGLFLGARAGYVQALSERVGLSVMTGLRAGVLNDYLYGSIVTRVGVHWQF